MIGKGEEQAIVITDFAPADEEATLAFCRKIFHDEGWPTEFMDSTIAAGFDRPRDLFLLAKQHGAIVGCGALKELSTDDALMTRFFVASFHRGSGLAARLFEALFERAHSVGYTTIILDVNRESARAIRFYEKQGMEEFIPAPHPGGWNRHSRNVSTHATFGSRWDRRANSGFPPISGY